MVCVFTTVTRAWPVACLALSTTMPTRWNTQALPRRFHGAASSIWRFRPGFGRISHSGRYAVHSRLLLICDSRLLCRRRSAMPKAKRKQLNIGITPDQYEAVRIAAEEEGQTITVYCREAILAGAMPEPELPDVATLPAWVIHFLLFLTRGKTRPAMPIE